MNMSTRWLLFEQLALHAKVTKRKPVFQQQRCYSAPVDGSIPLSKQKYIPNTGTYPKAFRIAGVHVGVKASNTRHPDLALITSDIPCTAAAVFTKNKFQAAPVLVSKEVLRKSQGKDLRAIVINSGCANAVTGKGGIEDAESMCATVDRSLRLAHDGSQSKTLVMSTGVIGQRLPIQKILDRIPVAHGSLTASHEAWLTAAKSICTTDTFPKLLSTTFSLPSNPKITYSLAGITKGAGMIHPNMATLLGIITTDAPIASDALHSVLTHAVSRSFNSISVDGDTSTNDTVAIMANGAGAPPDTTPIISPTDTDFVSFQETLTSFARSLSHLVVRDGEGATKFVTIRVTSAPTYEVGHAVASSIARSPLVKTALYGRDANWGRIICAAGYTASLPLDAVLPERTTVSFVPTDGSPELLLLANGEPEKVDEARAARILEMEDLEIKVDLGHRDASKDKEACYYTCDFSHEYVTINGDYRT